FFILPNSLNLLILASGLLVVFLLNRTSLPDHLLGVLSGYLSFFLISHLFKAARNKEGLGSGDTKLFAVAGAWLGWLGLPSVLLIACITSAVEVLLKTFS